MNLLHKKSNSNKKIILITAFIILVISFLAAVFIAIPANKTSDTNKKSPKQTISYVNIKQKIYFDEKNIKINNASINKGATALDLLMQTQNIETKGEGKNAFVITINNLKADDKKKQYWSFVVNGKAAEVGAGSYVLKNNDLVEWKIETY